MPCSQSYRMVPSIRLFLRQHSSQSGFQSICFEQVLLAGVWISQDQSTHHSILQLMKCVPGSFVQDHSLFLLFCHVTSCIFMQGICDPGKVLNKAPVVPNKSDKTLNWKCTWWVWGIWWWPSSYPCLAISFLRRHYAPSTQVFL